MRRTPSPTTAAWRSWTAAGSRCLRRRPGAALAARREREGQQQGEAERRAAPSRPVRPAVAAPSRDLQERPRLGERPRHRLGRRPAVDAPRGQRGLDRDRLAEVGAEQRATARGGPRAGARRARTPRSRASRTARPTTSWAVAEGQAALRRGSRPDRSRSRSSRPASARSRSVRNRSARRSGRQDAERAAERIGRVEEGLLVFLHVGMVGEGQALHDREQPDQVAVDPARSSRGSAPRRPGSSSGA